MFPAGGDGGGWSRVAEAFESFVGVLMFQSCNMNPIHNSPQYLLHRSYVEVVRARMGIVGGAGEEGSGSGDNG